VAAFSDQVDNRAMIFSTLDLIDMEFGEFTTAKTATQQNGQERTIPFSLCGGRVWLLYQRTGFFLGEPISHAHAKSLGSLDPAYARGEFGAEESRIRGLIS